jgi:hypothetical protein
MLPFSTVDLVLDLDIYHPNLKRREKNDVRAHSNFLWCSSRNPTTKLSSSKKVFFGVLKL